MAKGLSKTTETITPNEIPQWIRNVVVNMKEKIQSSTKFAENVFKDIDEKWRSSIESGLTPELAPATVQAKTRRGSATPDTPLCDSGGFKEGLAYKLEKTDTGFKIIIYNLSPVQAAWHLNGTKTIPARLPIDGNSVRDAVSMHLQEIRDEE